MSPERRGDQQEKATVRTGNRRSGGIRRLPVLDGLPPSGEPVEVTLQTIRAILETRTHGGAPHRGRERRGSGDSEQGRPHRHVRRRGTTR